MHPSASDFLLLVAFSGIMILTWYNWIKMLPKEMSIIKNTLSKQRYGNMLVPDEAPHILKAFLPTLTICKSLLLLFVDTTKPCQCYGGCSAVLDDTMPMMISAVQSATRLPPLEVLGRAALPWAARQGGCRMG